VLDDGADIERDDLRKSAGTFLEKLTSMSSQLSPCAADTVVRTANSIVMDDKRQSLRTPLGLLRRRRRRLG